MSATVLFLLLAVAVFAALGRAAAPAPRRDTTPRQLLSDVRSGARWLANHPPHPRPWVDH